MFSFHITPGISDCIAWTFNSKKSVQGVLQTNTHIKYEAIKIHQHAHKTYSPECTRRVDERTRHALQRGTEEADYLNFGEFQETVLFAPTLSHQNARALVKNAHTSFHII